MTKREHARASTFAQIINAAFADMMDQRAQTQVWMDAKKPTATKQEKEIARALLRLRNLHRKVSIRPLMHAAKGARLDALAEEITDHPTAFAVECLRMWIRLGALNPRTLAQVRARAPVLAMKFAAAVETVLMRRDHLSAPPKAASEMVN